MNRQMDRDWERGVIRYPDPAVEVIDPAFAQYVQGGAALERLHTGARWAEGPVWFGDGRYLLWSDIPNNRILRWVEETGAVSVFRSPAQRSNGNTRDRQGRLISCEHETRRVTRTEHDGVITVLIDSFQGKRLNAPNDVVVHPDGHIWFTDPGYGELEGIAHRADFDLKAHATHCGKGDKMKYFDQEKNERYTPHVIEPSAGADRGTLALLCEAYTPDENELAHARRIVDAFAAQPDAGTLSIDGSMVDLPHLAQEEPVRQLHDIGLVHRGDLPAPAAGQIEGRPRDARGGPG